ncbi:MAG TPA: type II toxin-antitoxin system VapB family antitoxin [Acidimicrobiales bacterium]|jgi:Arc/MetJ family transcription regulator|nr:type II toxin-antitoxin system VapB family antitoxin [Acidimicrobiales bacterium]
MGITQIDIDDEALADAMRLSGETTKKGTVNRALRDYVERHRRVESLERHAIEAKGWDYEGWRRLRRADKHPAG